VTANVSEADALKAANLIRTIVQLTLDGLAGLKSLKPKIEQISIPGCKRIISEDLKGLQISSSLLQAVAERVPVRPFLMGTAHLLLSPL